MNAPFVSPRFHLGIVTGLQFEATIAEDAIRSATEPPGDDRVTATCHGPGQARALSAAEALINIGASALLSFGVAGGCNPDLPPGTVVIATGIRDLSTVGAGDILYTNRGWQHRLKSLLLGNVLLEEGTIASVAEPVHGADAKRRLYEDGGAAAVDMESAAAARAAMEAGIPFMALRVIVDAAGTSLPPAAMAGMTPDGATQIGPVLRALLRRPQDIPGLIGIGIADSRARKAMKRASAVAAPLFGGV
jgi:adenosylhomocysteine nucleosidase